MYFVDVGNHVGGCMIKETRLQFEGRGGTQEEIP